MIDGLTEFLRERRSKIVKVVRTNIVRERVGYSEYTQWDTTVSFDEVEVFDFDALLEQIDEFGRSLNENKD